MNIVQSRQKPCPVVVAGRWWQVEKNKMIQSKRKVVAYIVLKLKDKNHTDTIYDYSNGSYFNFSGTVKENNINIFDYERNCYITGNPSSIFDYGSSQYIQLKINDNKFSGFDYETGSYFEGSVNNNNINFYDYQDGTYTDYSI